MGASEVIVHQVDFNSSRMKFKRTCKQCFMADKKFCLWTPCIKHPNQQSKRLRSCVVWLYILIIYNVVFIIIHYVTCLPTVLWWFMSVHTLLPQHKMIPSNTQILQNDFSTSSLLASSFMKTMTSIKPFIYNSKHRQCMSTINRYNT